MKEYALRKCATILYLLKFRIVKSEKNSILRNSRSTYSFISDIILIQGPIQWKMTPKK